MQDVNKVEGPSGPPESSGKKDKSAVDADKFKNEMRRRVTEVSQVDPDEQKKRKRQEESEEDKLEGTAAPEPTPSPQVTPFSLGKQQKKVSPMAAQGKGISPMQSAQKTVTPSPSPSSFYTPSPDEMADDAGILEEESFQAQPSASTQPPAQPPPPPPQREPQQYPTTQKPPVGPPQESRQAKQHPEEKKQEEKSKVGPPQAKKGAGLPMMEPFKQAGPPKTEKKRGTTAEELEGPAPAKAETAGFFEQLSKEKKVEEEAAALEGALPPLQPLPSSGQAPEKEKKIEEKELPPLEIGIGAQGAGGELPSAAAPIATNEPLPPYAMMHPQIMEIFDRMVGVMTVMSMSGMTETVITLNTPQFASSVFFGTQIIIREFSTAPQAFNIQLNGTPQAIALFQGNADDLMAAFQAGNYTFRVHRLETGLLAERPLFKRKEKAGGKEQDTGENPK